MNILTPEARTVLLKDRFPMAAYVERQERNAMIYLEMLVLAAKLKSAGHIRHKK